MSETAMRIEGLGKEYRIGRRVGRYRTLRDALSWGAAETARGMAARIRGTSGKSAPVADDTIWALRDVSLHLRHGDVLGVIGSNGAGKSTLLKILARVTEPTAGYAEVHGRVGSLLEVGTGFHPELTGRENTYLNGAILGMRRNEITRKFDQIVEFAEVERFIDTPVKHYSSGMYLRLAFSVAAHLEPEILLVDEVLAVGDTRFQQKCLGKMGDVAHHGRTVLFVSHNMDAIQRLCPRSLLLERGQVTAYGESGTVIAGYLSASGERPRPGAWVDVRAAGRSGTGEARFTAVRYTSSNEAVAGHAYPNGALEFEMVITSDAPRSVESMAVSLKTQTGITLVDTDIASLGVLLQLREGWNAVGIRIESLPLNPGVYVVCLWLGHSFGAEFDCVDEAFEIEVVRVDPADQGTRPPAGGLVPCRFSVARLDAAG